MRILLITALVLAATPAHAVLPSTKQKEAIKAFVVSKGIEADILDWSHLIVDKKLKMRAVQIEFKYKPVFAGQEILDTHHELFYLDSNDTILGTPITRPDLRKKFKRGKTKIERQATSSKPR